MSWFPKPSSPRVAFEDLRAFMRQRSREQLLGFTMALLVTAIIVIEFVVDSKINTAPPATIIYVENYRADRTDAEIIAEQKKDEAVRQAALEERRQQYQKLENQMGM